MQNIYCFFLGSFPFVLETVILQWSLLNVEVLQTNLQLWNQKYLQTNLQLWNQISKCCKQISNFGCDSKHWCSACVSPGAGCWSSLPGEHTKEKVMHDLPLCDQISSFRPQNDGCVMISMVRFLFGAFATILVADGWNSLGRHQGQVFLIHESLDSAGYLGHVHFNARQGICTTAFWLRIWRFKNFSLETYPNRSSGHLPGHETCVFPCPALVVLFINSSNVTSPLSSFDLVVMLGFALCVLTEIVSDIQKLGWNFVVGKGSSPWVSERQGPFNSPFRTLRKALWVKQGEVGY